MHTFNLIDSQILLGLSAANSDVEISFSEIISSCALVNHSIPTLSEFAEAFNKFLYVSAIFLNGDKIILGNFGREIIRNARTKASLNAQTDELAGIVFIELASYKLKSMCNRTVWTQAQYQLAIDALRDNRK